MGRPRVKISLENGTNTWVTYEYVSQPDYLGAILAAGKASALFAANMQADKEAVTAAMQVGFEADA